MIYSIYGAPYMRVQGTVRRMSVTAAGEVSIVFVARSTSDCGMRCGRWPSLENTALESSATSHPVDSERYVRHRFLGSVAGTRGNTTPESTNRARVCPDTFPA